MTRALATALAGLALFAHPQASGQPPAAAVVVRPLYTGVPVRASVSGNERTVFSFEVPAHTAAHLAISQEGIDVQWILHRAESTVPAYSLDYVAGPHGVEHVYPPIADTVALWQIVVSSPGRRMQSGDYTILLDEAPADDRARAVALARQQHIVAADPGPVGDSVTTSRAQAGYVAATAAALDAGDLEQAAESAYQCGRTYDVLGDAPTAIEWHRRALELFRRIGRRDREARTLNRLGDASRKIGEVSAAERYFEEALPLARAAGDQVAIADILNNSGLLMLTTGRYDEAIDRLQASIPLAQAVNSADVEGALTHNLGEAHFALGDYEKAIAFYERSIDVKTRMRLPRRIARTQQSLAAVYFTRGDRAKAEETITSATRLYRQAGDRLGLAEALGAAALMAHAGGDTDHALELFAEAQPILREVQDRPGEASVLTAWAEVELDRGATDAALTKVDEALGLSRAIANPQRLQKALYVRARVLAQANRVDEAIAAIKESIDSVETMRGALRRPDLRTSYVAAVRTYFDLYIDLLYSKGASAEAFEVSERARARTLLEGLAASAAKISKGVDPALIARRRAIQGDLNAKEVYRAQLAAASGANSAKAVAVTRDIKRLLDEWTDLQARIRASSPAFAELDTPEPTDAARVQQQLLDGDSALVEYHLGMSRSYVWVIDRQTITVHTLPAAPRIDIAGRRYHQLLSRDADEMPEADRQKWATDVATRGAQLSAMVWKPIERRVRGKRLLIVADGVLQYVPFAALPDSTRQPLLARHEIAYLPSASVLETIRKRSRPLTASAAATAVFADPVFSKSDPRFAAARDESVPTKSRADDGGTYGRLRFSRAEADAIHAVVPGAFAALDFAAAKQTLVGRDLRRYKILHFATHGSLNTEHPELSGLVFSLVDRSGKTIDGFLRLHEIYNLDLDADLVVLSACRTALGKEVHGEGLIGLTRGFMYAGASRVVSSVWNVDDRASARLMTRFYEAMLTKKMTPAAALRDAQLSLMREPRWANPHYWAAFGLQGEWK